VQRRIQSDLKHVEDTNSILEGDISFTERDLQRIEAQIESHKEWFRAQEAKEEERWRELDQDPDDINLNALNETQQTRLPRVPSAKSPSRGQSRGDMEDRVGNLTISQEQRVRGCLAVLRRACCARGFLMYNGCVAQMKNKVVSSKWESAFLTTEEATLAEKLQRYRTMFAEVKIALGVKDLDEFNETFSAREDQNFAIVQHINQLNEEAAQLEEEIDRVKTKAKTVVYVDVSVYH